MLLKDKVVVITGGAGLIGQEFSSAIMDQGGIVIIADIDEERMQCASKKLSQIPPSCRIDFF